MRMRGLEPPRRLRAHGPEPCASTNSATSARPNDSSLGSSHSPMTRTRAARGRPSWRPAQSSRRLSHAPRPAAITCASVVGAFARRTAARARPGNRRRADRRRSSTRSADGARTAGSDRARRLALPARRSTASRVVAPQQRGLQAPRRCLGVSRRLPAGSYHAPHDGTRHELIGAPTLWGATLDTAGQGVKIGIIDDGIDQTHPFFDPAGYTMPPGFPKGQTALHDREGDRRARRSPPKTGATAAKRAPAFDPRRLEPRHARRGHRRRQRRHADRAGPSHLRSRAARVPRQLQGLRRDGRRPGPERRTRPRSSPRSRLPSPTAWTSSTSRAVSRRSSRAATSSRARWTQPPRAGRRAGGRGRKRLQRLRRRLGVRLPASSGAGDRASGAVEIQPGRRRSTRTFSSVGPTTDLAAPQAGRRRAGSRRAALVGARAAAGRSSPGRA